ncbi:uncharacterized protein TrAtP1_003210 [Trichoderma atroviride]|uniref:uncharacterized protein n=1 Tax=Hypocrea atroviridis TaxID=63577 RepID=UPI00332907EF|nr:hypothetical protein TrAtP1_003210 [Trichoderma atroviride]
MQQREKTRDKESHKRPQPPLQMSWLDKSSPEKLGPLRSLHTDSWADIKSWLSRTRSEGSSLLHDLCSPFYKVLPPGEERLGDRQHWRRRDAALLMNKMHGC